MSMKVDQNTAETIALKALGFIAGDDDNFERFLMVSGAGPDALKHGVKDRFFLAGVLAFLLSQEPLLLEFCRAEKIDPHSPVLAQALLAGSDKDMNFI